MNLTPFKICFVFVTKKVKKILNSIKKNRLKSVLEISLLYSFFMF